MHKCMRCWPHPQALISRKKEKGGAVKYAGAGKRAWYTLIHVWANFLSIPRSSYTLANVRITFATPFTIAGCS